MKKWVVFSLGILIIASLVIGLRYYLNLRSYREIISNISIENIDLSAVKDGVYTGEFDAKLVKAKVEVYVENRKISKIAMLEHKKGTGEPAEVIPDRVVEAQSLDVDVISGSTNSSRVILKAIELALEKGM